jgi:hypothetical protein
VRGCEAAVKRGLTDTMHLAASRDTGADTSTPYVAAAEATAAARAAMRMVTAKPARVEGQRGRQRNPQHEVSTQMGRAEAGGAAFVRCASRPNPAQPPRRAVYRDHHACAMPSCSGRWSAKRAIEPGWAGNNDFLNETGNADGDGGNEEQAAACAARLRRFQLSSPLSRLCGCGRFRGPSTRAHTGHNPPRPAEQ